MGLKERILKSSGLAEEIEKSDIYTDTDFVDTGCANLNVAFSGDVDGGLTRGFTIIAGPSKHFKSLLGMVTVKAYMDKYPDSICMFYDSEWGTTPEYFKSIGIDTSRVVRTAITSLENFKQDISQVLNELKRGDRVIFFVDSLGNIPSTKEIEDARSGNDKQDMTRAKVMKSISRIAMLELNAKNLPMVAIGHTYDTLEMYSKKVVSGGTGIYYNANTIFIMGRRQKKNSQRELEGYEFVINVEKSRFVKEGTQIPLTVTYEDGVHKYSGLLEVALKSGVVTKPKRGWYTRPHIEDDKNWRSSEIDQMSEFWIPIFEDTNFKEFVKDEFRVKSVIFKEENNEQENREKDEEENGTEAD